MYLVRCNTRNYRYFLKSFFIFYLSCMQALMFPLLCLAFIHLFCSLSPSVGHEAFFIIFFFCDLILLYHVHAFLFSGWTVSLFMHHPSIFPGNHSARCSPVLLVEMSFPVCYSYCVLSMQYCCSCWGVDTITAIIVVVIVEKNKKKVSSFCLSLPYTLSAILLLV